jgi:hypothetical protein
MIFYAVNYKLVGLPFYNIYKLSGLNRFRDRVLVNPIHKSLNPFSLFA